MLFTLLEQHNNNANYTLVWNPPAPSAMSRPELTAPPQEFYNDTEVGGAVEEIQLMKSS